ncbi:hypothetical protein Tco_0011691 [Tanacetum coccineum]
MDSLVKEQEKEYQTGWKIKTGNVLDSCNQRSTQQCMKSVSGFSKVFWEKDTTRSTYLVNRSTSSAIRFKKPIDMLGVFGWHASIKQGMLEPVKIKNMSYNESGEYKKIFIGSGVGTGSMQVFHGFEFEVEPLGDHTFEVEPQENVDQGASLQEVQTQDLMDYQLACDREQHSAWELFSYKEDNNKAAFAVAAVDKIYAHESLTFNNTVASEVISNNGCKKCSDDNNGYYWEYTSAKGNVLGMEIITDHSGNTLRVSQSRFYKGKLVQTLLEGHSILSLEDSLSGDFGSQEYLMVYTRPDIASAGVDMLDGFDRGSLKANLQHMEALSTTEAGYMTFTEAWKKEIWLKGLLVESGYELSLLVP